MRKRLAVYLQLIIFVLILSGCGGTVSEYKRAYSFPEPTIQIKVTKAFQGEKEEFTFGPEVYDVENKEVVPIMEWFYGLELKECEKNKDIDENNYYDFVVDNEDAFIYYDCGDEAFLVVDSKWYTVENPSDPPIE